LFFGGNLAGTNTGLHKEKNSKEKQKKYPRAVTKEIMKSEP